MGTYLVHRQRKIEYRVMERMPDGVSARLCRVGSNTSIVEPWNMERFSELGYVVIEKPD